MSTSSLATGGHTITAVYSGDSNFTTSTSPPLTQSIAAATTGSNVVNFENLTVSASTLAEPLVQNGYDFTSSGTSAGNALMVQGPASSPWPGGWPSNVLMAAYWGTKLNITSASGGTFSITSLDVDVYEQAESAVITGYSSTGAVLQQQVENFSVGTGQHATDTANLGWTGVSKVTISWWQDTNGTGGTRFGAIDNVNFGQATATVTSLVTHTTNAAPASTSTAITPLPTTTGLKSSLLTSKFGEAVTFTVTVAGTSPGAGTPAGTVTFYDGKLVLGTATLNSYGVATFTTASLSVANHSITAAYKASGKYAGSSSVPLTQTVLPSVAVKSAIKPAKSI